MATKSPTYSHDLAVERLLVVMYEADVTQKEVAVAMGISESEFSQKKRGINNHFSFEELAEGRAFLSEKTRRPLIGFPFLDLLLQEAVDRQVGGWVPTPGAVPKKAGKTRG